MRKYSCSILKSCIGLVFCLSIQASAVAQSYKASDIVNHFSNGPSQTGGPLGLGQPRGLCIGTEAECSKVGNAAAKPAKAADPSAFDLVINFKHNSDVLEPAAKINLDEFVIALEDPRLASRRFLIEGHTDAIGSPIYNITLSERRANSVVRYLAERGVNSAMLLAKGFGQTRPAVQNPLAGDNRRVETRLLGE